MKLLFIYPQGRLGNLLFQISAANKIAEECNGLALAFASEATDYFFWKKVIAIPCPFYFRKLGRRLWCTGLKIFESQGLFGIIKPKISFVHEKFETEEADLLYKTGYCKNIFITKGFFQYEGFMSNELKMPENLLNKATQSLLKIPYTSRVGVHFRFGDYADWSVYGIQGSVLPDQYYRRAFEKIEREIKAPIYIVFTDDINQAEATMKRVDRDFVFFDWNSVMLDFASMAACSHLILSASTFAWWAAKLIDNPNKIILAPQYWLGFKSKKWFPKSIKTAGFTYITAE